LKNLQRLLRKQRNLLLRPIYDTAFALLAAQHGQGINQKMLFCNKLGKASTAAEMDVALWCAAAGEPISLTICLLFSERMLLPW
jgi:hypothetical protein